MPPDNRPHVRFVTGATLRVRAHVDAPAITAIDSNDIIGSVVASPGEFRHVEILRPHARIKGYVLATEVEATTDSLGTISTSGRGHGFSMSHADKIDVPAGTCLFDRAGGEVVGVQSEPSTRLGRAKLGESPGWSTVHVGTHWSTTQVYIRDTSTDPKAPKWESCTQPVHR
jgi:hypothetical protein